MLDEDTFTKLWKLTNDWAAQQKTNHELASGINKQLTEHKQHKAMGDEQAEETVSPVLLHRNTTDVDQATVELLADYKELTERYKAVVHRNLKLQRECTDLQDIIKSYEENMEMITEKLRSHTISAADGHVQLRREYEALLDAEKGTTAGLLVENMTLRHRLHQLAAMLRNAYTDQEDNEHISKFAELEAENRALREMLQLSPECEVTASKPTSIKPPSVGQSESSDRQQQQPATSSSGVVETYFEE